MSKAQLGISIKPSGITPPAGHGSFRTSQEGPELHQPGGTGSGGTECDGRKSQRAGMRPVLGWEDFRYRGFVRAAHHKRTATHPKQTDTLPQMWPRERNDSLSGHGPEDRRLDLLALRTSLPFRALEDQEGREKVKAGSPGDPRAF